MNEIHQIDSLAHLGDGEIQTEKEKLFVPFTLAGERVELSGKSARRQLVKIIEPSPDRVAPVCEHFGVCGGCQLQHFAHEPYLAWKQQLVAQALANVLDDGVLQPIISFDNAKRRRAVFSASNTADGVNFGFIGKSSHDLIAIHQCPVLDDKIVAKIEVIKQVVRPVLPAKGNTSVHVLACDKGLDIYVEIENAPNEKSKQAAMRLAIDAKIARLCVGEDILVETRRPRLSIGVASVTPPPGSFVQAIEQAEKVMAAQVCDHLKPCKKVADLFCGVGTFALPLAQNSTVLASENSQAALDALDEAWRGTGGRLKAITTQKRDLYFRPVMAAELKKIQGVVFDPPRAGAEAQAKQLALSKVRKIAAVSCNPTTLARDLEILLAGGFKMEQVNPIDQFVYTPHVEVVVLLGR